MPRKLPFTWCYFLVEMFTQNVHMSPQIVGKVGHRISHFRSQFQKMKTVFMFRRWLFSLTLKEFLKNSNPLQSYSYSSKLGPSKRLQHSARTCAARYSRQRAKWAAFQTTNWLFWLLPNFFNLRENNYFANIFLQTPRFYKVVASSTNLG